MNAEWNVNTIAEMDEEQNLRNKCRQLEQQYVDWHRDATVNGCRIAHEWPAIGELGRGSVAGWRVKFVTTHRRAIEVIARNGNLIATFKMVPGMARNLYVLAGELAIGESTDHCMPDGSPCLCERCDAAKEERLVMD